MNKKMKETSVILKLFENHNYSYTIYLQYLFVANLINNFNDKSNKDAKWQIKMPQYTIINDSIIYKLWN